MQTRGIDIGGLELSVAEAGAGGRPLLLCHGFTGAKEDFTAWVDPLGAAGWHVVVPDLRGHGDSDKPDGEDAYTLELFAADLLALFDALGWDDAVLLGHSMGGMVAQELVLKAPERVRALVLMDTHHGALAGLDAELLELGIAVALEQGMEPVADIVWAMGDDDPLATPAQLDYVHRHPERKLQSDRNLRVVSPYLYAAILRMMPAYPSRLDRLASVAVRTLVLVGEQDRRFLTASHELAATIPGARLAVLPDAGHSPQLENATAWWAALGGFLDEVTAVTAAVDAHG